MALPNLTAEDVSHLLQEVSDVGEPRFGGQKLVFPCTIEGKRWVVKFALVEVPKRRGETAEERREAVDMATARARREVRIMGQCDSPNIAKLGPIAFGQVEFKGQSVVYFSEEFIDGKDLRDILAERHTLPVSELIRLGLNITEAIRVLWSNQQIHRDIKPENIMRRNSDGSFVLLDMGLAFDLEDRSLTPYGFMVGTPRYSSPEQLDLARKRQMDFRSDLFSLGVVLYEGGTGYHPFYSEHITDSDLFHRILSHYPDPPMDHRSDLPRSLNEVAMRLLGKEPHLRYRSCEYLTAVLRGIQTDFAGELE